MTSIIKSFLIRPKSITLITLLFSVFLGYTQKKTITHADYDLWKNISDVKISNKGKLIVTMVETATKRGDGYLEIYNAKSDHKFRFFNGYSSSISFNENYVVFKRKPSYKTTREEKRKQIKKENKTKDDLFIYDVERNIIYDSITGVDHYIMPKKNGDWLVIEKLKTNKQDGKQKSSNNNDSKKSVHKAFNQNYALVYELKTKKKDTLFNIKDFVLNEVGSKLFYTLKGDKKKEKDRGIFAYDLKSNLKKAIDTNQYRYSKLKTSNKGGNLAYIGVKDSTSIDSAKYELYFYQDRILKKLIDIESDHLKKNWELSGDHSLRFSENDQRLYFYSKPIVEYQTNLEFLKDEYPEVDVWSWQDEMVQPKQKAKFEELSKEAFISYYDIEKNRYVHLQDENLDRITFDKKKEQEFVIAYDSSPYAIESSWNRPSKKDYYVINTNTGEKRLAIQNTDSRLILGTRGNYALYFDKNEKHWYALHLRTLKKKNLTKDLKVAFHNEEDDRPQLHSAYGFGGFDKDGNALVYDKFDIWKLFINGTKQPLTITKKGRESNITYRTRRLDIENKNNASYVGKELIVTSFNRITKASGLYFLRKEKLIEKIVSDEFFIRKYQKAKEANVFIFSKENFNTYPDIHVTKDNFKKAKKITDVNPQKNQFKWGTSELFSWTAYDGKKLEGIVYKPENFDPLKKYPLITHFYEKNAHELKYHIIPKPSASTVNEAYLVSNDYVLFIPDIVYNKGQPGADAYNCIVSGVEALEKEGYIDSENMAIQGQSWGGYQVAYLITVTNKFKAGMAGAPVSNMTSAYGGIRWKSGQSRASQYEKGQSRIGQTLWDGLDLYIKNSPLFAIPKIETPLLIMHNDADGAVPYYQGIEMFMGMRRLKKPVWMLVYNNEAHNLKKMKNKQDLSIRMMQFFDYYLKGKPAPKWMLGGIPRVQKGKDLGYELINK